MRARKSFSPLREAQKEVTRSKIREAARTLFNQQGFDNTTTEEIARIAALTRSTLYLHYRDKSEILADIVSEFAPHCRGWMETLPEAPASQQVLEDWFDHVAELAGKEPLMFSLVSELSSKGKGADVVELVTQQVLLGLSKRSSEFRKVADQSAPLELRAQAVFLIQQLTYFCQLRLGEANPAWSRAVRSAGAGNFYQFLSGSGNS